MSNGARAGIVVVAVAVAVIAFVALKPGGKNDKQTTTASSQTAADANKKDSDLKNGPVATAPSAPAPPLEVRIKHGAPVGGIKSLKVTKGDVVRLQVLTDESHDTLHLHGYDIEKDASAGNPANFRFKATIEGVFELESHTAEHAGREPLVARLVVEP